MKNKLYGFLFLFGLMASLHIPSLAGSFPKFKIEEEKDSIIIKLANNSKVMIYFNDKKELEVIRNYDLNKILHDLSKSLDSLEQANEQVFFKDYSSRYLKDTAIVMEKTFERKFNQDGNYVNYDLRDFSSIKMGGIFTLYVRQGNFYEVKAKGKTEDLEKITAKVKNGTLFLGLLSNTNNIGKIEVLITTPHLEEADFSGATTSYIKGFKEKDVRIKATGASNVDIDMEAEILDVEISGASKMNLSGSGKNLIVSASGASKLNAYQYLTQEATANASGAAVVNLFADKYISASATGASKIAYKGNPEVKLMKQNGAGRVWPTAGGIHNSERNNNPDSGTEERVTGSSNPAHTRTSHSGTDHSFNLELGLNNYLKDGSFPTAEAYALYPLGSRYVALSSIWKTHIGGPLSLEWGGNLSWYNFRFQDKRVRAETGAENIQFVEAVDLNSAIRSKLTAVYLGGTLVPMFHFGSRGKTVKKWGMNIYSKTGFRIGVGGYAGYRIDSYSRFVFKDGNDRRREREKDHFYLNNLRYGTRLQMGFRGLDLFANYDLNNLFEPDRGPKLNAFSFGIIF